jgi:hypothetical protein
VTAVDALAAKVRALQDRVDEAEGYAAACRAAATALHEPLAALGRVSVDVGGMRSRSRKVDRAKAGAEAAASTVHSIRSRLADAVSDLEGIAGRYQRRADAARLDLRAASMQLALATAAARP